MTATWLILAVSFAGLLVYARHENMAAARRRRAAVFTIAGPVVVDDAGERAA